MTRVAFKIFWKLDKRVVSRLYSFSSCFSPFFFHPPSFLFIYFFLFLNLHIRIYFIYLTIWNLNTKCLIFLKNIILFVLCWTLKYTFLILQFERVYKTPFYNTFSFNSIDISFTTPTSYLQWKRFCLHKIDIFFIITTIWFGLYV